MRNLKVSIFTLLFGLCLIGCDQISHERKNEVVKQLTEEELRQQLKIKECDFAQDYISGKFEYRPIYRNFFSSKVKGVNFSCAIYNKATVATFKDVMIRVKFITKTEAVILDKTFTIYDFVAPKDTVIYSNEISMTNQDYEDIAELSWNVIGATCN
jgi:hypothetical protein